MEGRQAGAAVGVAAALIQSNTLLKSARAIEPLCMLWCIPGFLRNDWVHAFKLLA